MKNPEAHPLNIEGKLFCTSEEFDNACISCGLCHGQLPSVFTEDSEGYAYVHKQPSQDELIIVEELISDCPSESIQLVN